ncbi:hypothetical protein [Piscinibacter sp.]|uniref:hypothetical protein n=1 Tax=Piscinibacter sp. TaxID=1903157 RepID=UPI0011D65053|nr:MAG: hypothetical protein E6Q93_04080 [Burkholderiaceae bacterium]
MAVSAPFEKYLLDIGYGLKVGLKGQSVWQVWAKNGCFDLNETSDFCRVLVLLEKPYSEAKALLDGYADNQRAERGFPMWRVVDAGLACQSDQWAGLALKWLPDLPEGERGLLRDSLLQVHGAKWASQKSRQLAERYAKQIGASEQ